MGAGRCGDIVRYSTSRVPNPFPISFAKKRDGDRLGKPLWEARASIDVSFRSRPFLVGTPKTPHVRITKGDMFRFSARCSGSPHTERRRLHFSSHHFDHLAGSQTELSANRIERGSIFPSHLDDAIDICWSE
jgi:hypothetical protein